LLNVPTEFEHPTKELETLTHWQFSGVMESLSKEVELETQRQHLSRIMVAEQNRLVQLNDKELQRLTRRLLATLKKQMAAIDMRMVGLIAEDQTLKQKTQKLTTIAGVGTRPAVLLLARMPELRTLNRTQAAALAGLAPFNHDSGTLRGKRTIFGGRRALRCGLYIAALVAARHNLILRSFYQRLRSNGKPHKVALTAVMRKLLLALNHPKTHCLLRLNSSQLLTVCYLG
jgi:transposase